MKKIPVKHYAEITPGTVLSDPIEGEIVREGERVYLVTII